MVEEAEKAMEIIEWEAKAKEWVSKLPKEHKLSVEEVEKWVNSNHSCLPEQLKSLSHFQLLQRFTDLRATSSQSPASQEAKQVNRGENPARFQRTDQWRPVYSWLESLDSDEVIKSKDISDWLAANPEIYDQLCSKHSRHHLMHYVKKCHMKILKKRKGPHYKPIEATPLTVVQLEGQNLSASFSGNQLTSVSKDSDLYRAKRQEALQKYEILVELEKQLSAIIPKPHAVANSKES